MIKRKNAVGFVIAGTHSSVGKSSAAIGIMRLLKKKGFNVKPFKVGPDYIDPSHHALACGSPSYNLDTWMCTPQYTQKLCADILGDETIAVVEGVMGLFDGARADKNIASTAEVARLLNLPIILVVDGKAMARSIAAMVNGYTQFDPNLRFLGVIANHVNSLRHADILKKAIDRYTSVRFLGYLPDKPYLSINKRHLGLFQAHEQEDKLYDLWADHIDNHLDVSYILQQLRNLSPLPVKQGTLKRWPLKANPPFTVAIARDEAFQFVYQDTLDMFQHFGGAIKFFSPLTDRRLPDNIDWIYLPGGYPELFAQKLSANKLLISEIRQFGKSGKPIVAECGGLMYLGKSIITEAGQSRTMVGLFNFSTSMKPKQLTIGYRKLNFKPDAGSSKILTLKGHEFHFSSMVKNRETSLMTDQAHPEIKDGYRYKNCFAMYSHIYWASSPHWLKYILQSIVEK